MQIPFHKPYITDDEISEVVDSLKSGWITMGPKTVRFEEEFGRYVGSKHAIAVNSCTAALHLALKAIDLKPGDEVIIPSMTFTATGEVVCYFGAKPGNLSGVDLLPDRIETTSRVSPNIDFRCGSAKSLPYENETFDIVMQFTVFTSILDTTMKQSIARDMLRVLKPDGMILWYDYHMNNPRNRDVRGVKKKEIYKLFPNCEISLKRITLAPPLARAIAPYSWPVPRKDTAFMYSLSRGYKKKS